MEYENPILITLNNTLHIKADNLEPVEVDSSCADELSDLVFKGTKWFIKGKTNDKYYLQKGVDISELSDRIEVRESKVVCEDCPYKTHPCAEGCSKVILTAFLLPEKEVKCDGTCADNECICDDLQECLEIVDKKSYSIEEIERAIDKLPFSQVLRNTIKVDVNNNLKTKTI